MRNYGKSICAWGVVAAELEGAHTVHMPTHSTHYLRAWRKHRGYSLMKVAERIGMSHQNLGKIERGQVPYNQPLLELLAEEYRCEIADLIVRDPTQPDPIWSIWDKVPPTERNRAIKVLTAFTVRTGTKG